MWIFSKIGLLITSILGLLGSVLVIFKYGQKDQKNKQEIKDLSAYKETREKLDEVVINDDVDAALDRLSKSKGLRD
jgi:hypothetical protein